jgi:hypothetical protein
MLLSRCRPWLLLSLVTFAVPVVGTSPARAEEVTKQEARALFQEALALVAAGDYATALEKLQRVATFRRTPQVAFYIGVCHEKTGKLVMALGEYRIALADAQSTGAADVVSEATEAIAKLEPRIPLLTIHKGEGAQTATISVDGKTLGDPAIGKPMPFDPGTRTVIAQAPGYSPFRQEVRLGEGEKVSIDVAMKRRSGGAVAAGTTTPPPSKEPAPSERSSDATSMTLDPESGSNTLAWVATGVGVAGLGASGYFFYQRNKAISDLDEICGGNRNACPSSLQKIYDDGKRDTMIGNIALGVGVVGVTTGVILFLASSGSGAEQQPTQPDQPGLAVRLAPPGDAWAGLTVDGRF